MPAMDNISYCNQIAIAFGLADAEQITEFAASYLELVQPDFSGAMSNTGGIEGDLNLKREKFERVKFRKDGDAMHAQELTWKKHSGETYVGKTFSDKAVEVIFRTAYERKSATVCNACGTGNIPKQTATYNYQNR